MTISEMKNFALDVLNRGANQDEEKLALAHGLYAFCEFYQKTKRELASHGIIIDDSDILESEDDSEGMLG